MAKITTINQAVSLVKKNNPGCYITRGMIEHAIKNNEIGCICIGNRMLLDYEQLQEYIEDICNKKYVEQNN